MNRGSSSSCCPTNVARTFASLASYLATADGGGLQIHQYADSRIAADIDAGRRVGVEVTTGYPYAGVVDVTVVETDDRPWAITLRVPPWAAGAELVDGDVRRVVPAGNAVVERVFASGDEITLRLPLEPRWTLPDPRIDAVRGCAAVERGPLVMCAESVDVPGQQHVDLLRVDASNPPRDDGDAVVVAASLLDAPEQDWPYTEAGRTDAVPASEPIELRLIPYHRWATRGPSTMRVWLPRSDR